MFDCRVTLVSILSSLNERGIILKREDILKLLQFDTPIKEGVPRDLVFNVLGEEILHLRGLDMKRYPSSPSEDIWEIYDSAAECWRKLEKLRDMNLAEYKWRKMMRENYEL